MKIHLKFFASVRERLNLSSEVIELNSMTVTAFGLRQNLIERDGVWADALGHHRVLRIARNQEMLSDDIDLEDGDELAFFPPVTGG